MTDVDAVFGGPHRGVEAAGCSHAFAPGVK